MRLEDLSSPLELATEVVRPLTRQRRPQLGLLATRHQLAHAGPGLEHPLLELTHSLVGGLLGVGQRTLAGQRVDLQLLGLSQ